jgi:hypothetical protein
MSPYVGQVVSWSRMISAFGEAYSYSPLAASVS